MELTDTATASARATGAMSGTGLTGFSHLIALPCSVAVELGILGVALKIGAAGESNGTVGQDGCGGEAEQDGLQQQGGNGEGLVDWHG